jgi:hypothetical protein
MVDEDKQALQQEIDQHKNAISALESRIQAMEARPESWPEFYFVYYCVAGLMIGVIGALTSFLFNVVGSMIVHQDPMQLIRVFGTFFVGEEALTSQDLNFLMLVLMSHFSVGSVAGAIYHVTMNKYFADRSYEWKLMMGVAWGLAIWIGSFYLVISWVQPMMVGEAFILDMIPFWVAALTHIVYGVTIGLLEPIGRFTPYQVANGGSDHG